MQTAFVGTADSGDKSPPSKRLNKHLRAFLCFLLSLVLASCLPVTPSARAQESTTSPTGIIQSDEKADLHQALLDLTNPWTVMCVAAHPDDEDGTTLTVLRRKYGAHTVSLFSTYGEGGQNAIGPELYEELGVIRAHETIRAAELQGSEPYFLGLRDFGYSKSAAETFSVWGHDEALRRMVLQVRKLRPDVIITNHDTNSGHGHHQATGRLVLEAFDAAADPKRFSEQLRDGVQPWQPQRLFVRVGYEGGMSDKLKFVGTGESAERTVTIEPNERDPVRGTTYAEQALQALQKHTTQGPWPATVAEWLHTQNENTDKLPPIRYRLARAVTTAALPTGSKSFVDGLLLPSPVSSRLVPPTIESKPLTEFEEQREQVLNTLLSARGAGAYTAADDVLRTDPQRFRLMSSRLDRAICAASGIELTLSASDTTLVPNVKELFTITLANSGDAPVDVRGITFQAWGTTKAVDSAEKVPAGTDTASEVEILTPTTAGLTVPSELHLYDGRFLGERLAATAEMEINGARFLLSTEARIAVSPGVEIGRIEPSSYVWSPATLGSGWSLDLTLTNNLTKPFLGRAIITGANGLTYEAISGIALRPHETTDNQVRALAKAPAKATAADQRHSGFARVSIVSPDSKELITERRLNAVYTDARAAPGLLVGYLPSFDKTLGGALAALGIEAKELTVAGIQGGSLADYSAIVIDNRGYQAHPELVAANARLLDYVRNGGTLIVFYQKANEWNPDQGKGRPQLAPYAIILGNARVTDENSVVRFLQPRHPLLLYPNRIGSTDFKNWIQERGLYYPTEWDSHYTALLATSDPGEAPRRGGLLAARYGSGHYIYTSMVWYRQLRAGVPGAYRMLANMVSYGH